jgi:S-adenosylmethionine hydrolase
VDGASRRRSDVARHPAGDRAGRAEGPGSRPALITLTTDFGLRDPYVAQMKGVILSTAPDVRIVDVTHEVAPHDIAEGALALEAAAPHFPSGTVHVGVVDPGVGTARRGVAVASRGAILIGPDNGLFTPFLDAPGWHAVELRAPEFRPPRVSPTFHGRDVFAPVAAHVAAGVPLARLGPPVRDLVRLPWPAPSLRDGSVEGEVVAVDRFGNLITSLAAGVVEALGPGAVIRLGTRTLALVATYGELRPGEAGGLIGSSGRLEIAARESSAAARLGAGRGAAIVVSSRTASRETRTRSRKGSTVSIRTPGSPGRGSRSRRPAS